MMTRTFIESSHRPAVMADVPAIAALMERAIGTLQSAVLNPAQVAASRTAMGLDTQLIADGTYLVVEAGGRIAGCGGWSRRATLYGGDDGSAPRDARLLDPTREAARIRAMYTDPDFVRQGIGRRILALCEAAARAQGFARVELMATLAGIPLYRAAGYTVIEAVADMARGAVPVPGARMGKALG